MLRFTLFLAAFLLFLVQPLAGKILLPVFGGGAAVWNACLLFFQAGLLAGYLLAHTLRCVAPRAQVAVHAGLLMVAAGALATRMHVPEPDWAQDPTLEILSTLFLLYGPAYLVLAMHSPLLQHWHAQSHAGRSAYHLYAVSNAGSLSALVLYPFLIEPFLAVSTQRRLYVGAFSVLMLSSLLVALRCARSVHPQQREIIPPRPPGPKLLWWALLSACGAALLMTITNQICTEVAPAPFLWILPLTLYSGTYILCFRQGFRLNRNFWNFLLAAAVLLAVVAWAARAWLAVPLEILVLAILLFAACMNCHGELAESRPDSRHLTLYYLVLTFGGVVGGSFVALAAPRLFSSYMEFPVLIVLCCLLAAWPRFRLPAVPTCDPLNRAATVALLLAAVSGLALIAPNEAGRVLESRRNFYGILRVAEEIQNGTAMRVLRHGMVRHGLQLVSQADAREPTSYYSRESGVGVALNGLIRRNSDRPIRVGILGQGTGALAAYGRQGDEFVFYEIDRDVDVLARKWFNFIGESRARVTVKLGDARAELEQEARSQNWQNFDLIAVDVFSSGAIPVHLLTVEAINTYRAHLKPEGLILLHISNRTIDLSPVTQALARHFHLGWVAISNPRDVSRGVDASKWVVLTSDKEFLRTHHADVPQSGGVLWTDDYASLWKLVRF
jgi:hypothetical protein